MSSVDVDIRKFLAGNGFYLHRTGKYQIWRHGSAKGQLVISVSSSDKRALKNVVSQAKKLLKNSQTATT